MGKTWGFPLFMMIHAAKIWVKHGKTVENVDCNELTSIYII